MFQIAIPELALPGYPRPVFCLNRSEARHVNDHDVPAYFRYGIWVRPGDVVFDVGANIGLFTLAALARSDERAMVYAFEPVAPVRHVLSLNVTRLAGERVKVLPFGLSRQRGGLSAADAGDCEVRTLSEAMKELGVERIDLLKLDVEGAEFDVLEGIAVDDWRRIRKIVLALEHFSTRAADAVALLEARGYSRVIAVQTDAAGLAGDVGMIYAVASAAARP